MNSFSLSFLETATQIFLYFLKSKITKMNIWYDKKEYKVSHT